jgi:hypothetical protein
MARDNVSASEDVGDPITGGITLTGLNITPLSTGISGVQFLNFILDSFKDSYNINTNSEVLFGRTDPFRTYTNTERVITFGITVHADEVSFAAKNFVPASAPNRADVNFQKLQNLIRGAYPAYNITDKTLATPPLFRVYMTNLIQEGPNKGITGYFDNITFDYQDPSGFSNVPYGKHEGRTIPRVYSLSFSFHPLHEQPLGDNLAGSDFATPEYMARFPYGGNVRRSS